MTFLKYLIIIALSFQPILQARVNVRVKDIVSFEGVRGNQLVGYGLVVGLNNTGDTVNNTPFTKESLASMLERLGVNVRTKDGLINLNGKNVAAVMVTATLPAFSRKGTKIDVTVSALGDSKDLRGGTLLVTPLLAADGQVYAVAQGSVASDGFSAEGKATNVTKGVPTSGRISSGAIVEKEVGFELQQLSTMKLSLNNPDFTTAKRLSDTINKSIGDGTATPLDPSTVSVTIPGAFNGRTVDFMTTIEQLRLEPDSPAKIVVDDHNGVIVIGANVRVSTVAISHGSITIKVTETPQVSQPNPFTQVAKAEIVDRTDIKVTEQKGKFAVLEEGVTLQQLVDALNLLGATPREIITILQSIKAAGALQAEIEII